MNREPQTTASECHRTPLGTSTLRARRFGTRHRPLERSLDHTALDLTAALDPCRPSITHPLLLPRPALAFPYTFYSSPLLLLPVTANLASHSFSVPSLTPQFIRPFLAAILLSSLFPFIILPLPHTAKNKIATLPAFPRKNALTSAASSRSASRRPRRTSAWTRSRGMQRRARVVSRVAFLYGWAAALPHSGGEDCCEET